MSLLRISVATRRINAPNLVTLTSATDCSFYQALYSASSTYVALLEVFHGERDFSMACADETVLIENHNENRSLVKLSSRANAFRIEAIIAKHQSDSEDGSSGNKSEQDATKLKLRIFQSRPTV